MSDYALRYMGRETRQVVHIPLHHHRDSYLEPQYELLALHYLRGGGVLFQLPPGVCKRERLYLPTDAVQRIAKDATP